MLKFFFGFLALGLLALSPAAYAQKSVSDEGAAQLKQVVEETLKFERDVAAKSGSGLKMGDPEIANKGSYYEVRLPEVSYAYPGMGVIHVGTIVMNVTHGESDDEYLASMAVPATMTFTADDGEKLVMNIGSQKFAMAWQASLRTPTRVDAHYKDIAITADGKEPFSGRIGETRIVINLQKNDAGKWSGPIETDIHDVSANLPATANAGAGTFKIDRIYNKADYDSLDLTLALNSKRKIEELVNNAGGQNVEDTEQVLNAMLQDGAAMFNGAKTEILVSGFAVDVAAPPAAEGQTPEQPRSLKLAEFSSLVDLKGVAGDKGSLSARASVKDLIASNVVDPATAGYLPQNGNIEIYLEDLPMQSLYKAFAGLLVQGTRAAKLAEEAEARGQPSNMPRHHESQVMAVAMAVPQMLTGAGSTLAIRNTYINASEMSGKLFGNFKATPGAAKVGVGDMTLTIQGLDELLKKLETANTREARRALQGLSFLQVLGQQDTEDGKPVRKYAFSMTADGKMTLNGAEIGSLMGGMPQ